MKRHTVHDANLTTAYTLTQGLFDGHTSGLADIRYTDFLDGQ